ncbi:MAG TPA: OmpH family outer membrane protein [Stellaceae bacterium]|nr:OmpH family outer membrane protein [Stellaceae bacterium]
MSLRRFAHAVSAALLCLMALAAVPARAQAPAPASPPPPTVVVIADINQILHDAKSAKDVQSQIDRAMADFSKQVSTSENELQQMRDELERERSTLSPDAFSAKSRQYQQRFDALDRTVQGRRQALQQSYNESMTKIENTALQIIAQIAGEHKANMVLTRAAVLFAANNLDITAEVTKRLDDQLPTMQVKLPPPGAPAPAPAPAKH